MDGDGMEKVSKYRLARVIYQNLRTKSCHFGRIFFVCSENGKKKLYSKWKYRSKLLNFGIPELYLANYFEIELDYLKM